MGVASGCGEQEVGVASGSGWNLWVWLLGVVRRYIFPHTTYQFSYQCVHLIHATFSQIALRARTLHCLQTFSLQSVNQIVNGNVHTSLQMW